MKYSLSSRQSEEYLMKCDDIRVLYHDKDIIFTLIEKYPDKSITLFRYYHHETEEIDWNEIENYKILTKNNFLFGVSSISDLISCVQRDIPCFYLYPVTTFRDIKALKELGVSQLIIDAPLFFQMDKVKTFGIPIRAAANLSNRGILPTTDAGIVGPWIRPEDVSIYEKYIDIIEFLQVNLKQEQALFRIYAEQHEWPGDLNLIINDLDSPALNRLIPPTFAKSRLNCGHRCQELGTCHICWRFLNLADEEKLRALTQNTSE